MPTPERAGLRGRTIYRLPDREAGGLEGLILGGVGGDDDQPVLGEGLVDALGQVYESIHVAASTIPGQYYLPKLIQGFRGVYPDISFSLQVLDSTEVAERVAGRKAEIGFSPG